jgi:hypothetical protein
MHAYSAAQRLAPLADVCKYRKGILGCMKSGLLWGWGHRHGRCHGGKGSVCDVQRCLSPTVFGALTGGKPGGAQTHSQSAKSLLDNESMMMSIALMYH